MILSDAGITTFSVTVVSAGVRALPANNNERCGSNHSSIHLKLKQWLCPQLKENFLFCLLFNRLGDDGF
jgi:hypothetical protein